MKKIPKGAEASNILVGEVDFLDKPLPAFIRYQLRIALDQTQNVLKILTCLLTNLVYGNKTGDENVMHCERHCLSEQPMDAFFRKR
jgi:hypothetical protein